MSKPLRTSTSDAGIPLVHGYWPEKFGGRELTMEAASRHVEHLHADSPVLIEGGEYAGQWVPRADLAYFGRMHASRYMFDPNRDRIVPQVFPVVVGGPHDGMPVMDAPGFEQLLGHDYTRSEDGRTYQYTPTPALATDAPSSATTSDVVGAASESSHSGEQLQDPSRVEVTSHGGFETAALGTSNVPAAPAAAAPQREVRGSAGRRQVKP